MSKSRTADKQMGGRGNKTYPWESWLKRGLSKRVSLKKGKDFIIKETSMAQQLRNAAYRWRYKVTIEFLKDGIRFKSRPFNEK